MRRDLQIPTETVLHYLGHLSAERLLGVVGIDTNNTADSFGALLETQTATAHQPMLPGPEPDLTYVFEHALLATFGYPRDTGLGQVAPRNPGASAKALRGNKPVWTLRLGGDPAWLPKPSKKHPALHCSWQTFCDNVAVQLADSGDAASSDRRVLASLNSLLAEHRLRPSTTLDQLKLPGDGTPRTDDLGAEIRHAYRMLNCYQSAILSSVDQLATELGAGDFLWWCPHLIAPPPPTSSHPTSFWPWRMLPMLCAEFAWTESARANKIEIGDRLTVLVHHGDRASSIALDRADVHCPPTPDDDADQALSGVDIWRLEMVRGRHNDWRSLWLHSRSSNADASRFESRNCDWTVTRQPIVLDAITNSEAIAQTATGLLQTPPPQSWSVQRLTRPDGQLLFI